MNPTTTQQVAPQTVPAPVATPVTPQEVVIEAPKEDILKRVATNATVPNDAPKVSVSMDDIKDPAARQVLEKRLAEANASISKTFGEVGADKAKLMKQVEQLQAELNQPWTPQRLQQHLNKQDFRQSAESLQAQAAPNGWEGSQAEWSTLTPGEKQQFQNLVASQNNLTQQMNQMLQSQVDIQLKTKYPDYDPSEVDSFYRESAEGRVAPDRIREMIYKALKYETHINRAVEITKADKLALNQERVNGMAINTSPTTLSANKPEKQAGESTQSWLSKVTKWNLEQVAKYRANQKQ